MTDDTKTTDELIAKWLNAAQAAALRQYVTDNGVPDEHVRLLARMTGRGYRPPTTADGWREIHDMLKDIGALS